MPYDLSSLLAVIWSGWTGHLARPSCLAPPSGLHGSISWGRGVVSGPGRTQKTRDDLGFAKPTAFLFLVGRHSYLPPLDRGRCWERKPVWHFGNVGIYVACRPDLGRDLVPRGGARIHLGRFWVERDYAQGKVPPGPLTPAPTDLCAHPIYTGLIAGMLATGCWRSEPVDRDARRGARSLSRHVAEGPVMEEGFPHP